MPAFYHSQLDPSSLARKTGKFDACDDLDCLSGLASDGIEFVCTEPWGRVLSMGGGQLPPPQQVLPEPGPRADWFYQA